MAFYSNAKGPNTAQGVSLNDTRRVFNFGERVAELAPQQSPFFVYLSKVAKKATNDPVFKFLEQRHQWQRRNFKMEAESESAAASGADTVAAEASMDASAYYDEYGKISSSAKDASFLINNQVVAIECDYSADGTNYTGVADSHIVYLLISAVTDATDGTTFTGTFQQLVLKGTGVIELASGGKWKCAVGCRGQVVGSAWAEGTTNPGGWEDKLFDREGYCQIFKTGMNPFSGTSMATEYRGVKNEWQRIWTDKLMEHKMDLEHAFLFGTGAASAEAIATAPTRRSWGILPYTEGNGKVYSMSYASSGYDAFLDAMEDFFAPEGGNSGNKLVLASRKVITYLNKLGNGSFLNNSVGSSQYRLDIQNIKGAFGHQVTMVNTIFGNLHFVAEPLLRGMWEDYCICVDMKNVAYRPLAGNGISRDTFIETNVQTPGTDGRQDQIITEAGLEISLPETHAILKFS